VEQIEEYLGGVTQEVFFTRKLLQDGVVRQLEIIGEAAKRLSPEIKSRAPHIPWKRVTGMRDKLIHDYMGVDLKAVWDTTQKNLPSLRKAAQDLLA